MVRTDRWKYVWWQGYRPMLFDLANDPKERRDLGADQTYAPIFREMEERLDAWEKARKTSRHRRQRLCRGAHAPSIASTASVFRRQW